RDPLRSQNPRSRKVTQVVWFRGTLPLRATRPPLSFYLILPNPIPPQGAVLNQLPPFWFRRFHKIDNHFITADFDDFPKQLQPFRVQLAGRSMIVRKAKPLAVECVVRGYLAGSGWKEYQESQSVCGVKLPPGLKLASQLPAPIFTPATKSDSGHDLNIDWEE